MGEAGDDGTLQSGGAGGVTYPNGGANAGPGGDGGDFQDAAQSGTKGTQDGPGIGYGAPSNEGAAGPDGKAYTTVVLQLKITVPFLVTQ